MNLIQLEMEKPKVWNVAIIVTALNNDTNFELVALQYWQEYNIGNNIAAQIVALIEALEFSEVLLVCVHAQQIECFHHMQFGTNYI